MKSLVFIAFYIGLTLVEGISDLSGGATTKLSSTKSAVNSIPSSSSQKTSSQPQTQPQYVTHYMIPKQSAPQPPAIYMIAQPQSHGQFQVPQHLPQTQSNVHPSQSPLFQQAVQQLLSYYNNNPQARLQLLQQQQGHVAPQGGFQHPQAYQPQSQLQSQPQGAVQFQQAYPQPSFQHPTGAGIPQQTQQQPTYQPQPSHMPTGALHVIPSPHFPSSAGQPGSLSNGAVGQSLGGAHYIAVPAQGNFPLGQGLPPGLLSQLTSQQLAQHMPPQHIFQQQVPSQHFSSQSSALQHLSAQQISPHQFSQSSGSSSAQQLAQQYLSGNFQSQPQFSHSSLSSSSFGSTAPQGNFGLKSGGSSQSLNTNEYVPQTSQSSDKSSPQTASSNYNPVYRATYIKG